MSFIIKPYFTLWVTLYAGLILSTSYGCGGEGSLSSEDRESLRDDGDKKVRSEHKSENGIQHDYYDVIFDNKFDSKAWVDSSSLSNVSDSELRDKYGFTPLHIAVVRADFNKTKEFIENGADIHVKDNDGNTPLHYTVFFSRLRTDKNYAGTKGGEITDEGKIIRLLLKKGADVNARNKRGETPLLSQTSFGWNSGWGSGPGGSRYSCGMCDKREIVELFIDAGTDVNAKSKDGNTVLHIYSNFIDNFQYEYKGEAAGPRVLWKAQQEASIKIIELIIDAGADVKARNYRGETPLHVVNDNGIETINLLIKQGADVNAQNRLGKKTPLMRKLYTSRQRYGDPAEYWKALKRVMLVSIQEFDAFKYLLVDKGADPNIKDYDRETVLHHAARAGFPEATELLVNNGADVDVKNRLGETPLIICIKKMIKDKDNPKKDDPKEEKWIKDRYLKVIELLIAGGADLSVQDRVSRTPLHIAVEGGHLEIAKLLIEKGADLNLQGGHYTSKKTPLHIASKEGHLEIARFLLEKGANVDARDKAGNTPLRVVAWKGHLEIAKLLIEKGADVKARNYSNFSPLYRAVYHGHLEIVKLLVGKGADPNSPVGNGHTPLSLARIKGFKEIAEFLESKAKDAGKTALDFAKEYGHSEILEFLKKHETTR